MQLPDWLRRRRQPDPAIASTPVPSTAVEPVALRFSTVDWQHMPWWRDLEQSGQGRVTREYALSVSSVLQARNQVCGIIATQPPRVLDVDNNVIRSPLLEQIDPDVPNPVTLAQIAEDLLFEGIGWLRVLARDFEGYPVQARRVDPAMVSVQPPAGFIPGSLPSGYVPGSILWVDGSPVYARDMLRFDSLNPAILVHGARTIRRAYALEKASELFATNPAVRAYFTPKDGEDPADSTKVDTLLEDWQARRLANVEGYVPAWAERKESTGYSPAELQLATLIEKATVAVAGLFGVDPEDLGVSTTSRTYANAVDRRLDKKSETYAPVSVVMAARLSMGDITRRGQRVEFDWGQYLMPNPTDRATYAQTMIGSKVKTRDEVRRDEGLPPLTAAQRKELEPAPPPPQLAAPPQSAEGQDQGDGQPSNVVQLRPAQGFSGGAALVFDGLGDADTISVDEKRRTITGLVVPWNRLGYKDGVTYRFAPGSLQFSKAHVNQIKLFADHDPTTSVGYVARTWDDGAGQWATFKVARGPEGDRALMLAADGAKDGLSVGIGYAGENHGVTAIPDPEFPGGVYITSAPWRETSQVALPAFTGARVTAVSMAADPASGVPMSQPTSAPAAAPQAAPAPAPVPNFAQLLQLAQAAPAQAAPAQAPAVAAGFSAADVMQLLQLVAAGQVPTAAPQAPAVVNPVAVPVPGQDAPAVAVTQVREQPLYRFDGNPAQRSLLKDLKTGFDGSAEQRGKAEEFIAAAMRLAFANVSASDTATLNPAIQRPDLFVPRLQFTRPLGSMMTGGVVDSITRSTLPKFNTATNLAATHSAGNEPVDGTFTTTSQNIDPSPISGILKVNREVIDQGGSPQADQVMWNVMTQFYAELLEQRAENLLDGLALTPQTVVGVHGLLSSNLLARFTALQFLRGGDRYSALALHQAFYNALAGATDANDRPLFPMESPANANGGTAGDLSSIRVHGKLGVPGWPLETTNGGPATPVSYLWVPSSVYQWFSPPRRIDLSAVAISHVDMGIWGYSAEFALRDTDVIELQYSQA